MFRMNGQFFAPAKTALPPSLAVVCRDAMTSHGCDLLDNAGAYYPDGKERILNVNQKTL